MLVTEGRAVRGNNGGNHAVIQTTGKRRFLVEDPRISFREGRFKKVPMMIGVTKHEGSFFLGSKYRFYNGHIGFIFNCCHINVYHKFTSFYF